MGSKAPSSKSGAKTSEAPAAGSDKAKTAKLAFAILALVGTAAWLIFYFDPFEMRKPDPGPPPDAFIEQLPQPEQDRINKERKAAEDRAISGEELPAIRGE